MTGNAVQSTYQLLISGESREGSENEAADVFYPATGEAIGNVAYISTADLDEVAAVAAQGLEEWQAVVPWHRGRMLKDAARILRSDIDRIAHVTTIEQGKPLAEAREEIERSADFLEWGGEQPRRYAMAGVSNFSLGAERSSGTIILSTPGSAETRPAQNISATARDRTDALRILHVRAYEPSGTGRGHIGPDGQRICRRGNLHDDYRRRHWFSPAIRCDVGHFHGGRVLPPTSSTSFSDLVGHPPTVPNSSLDN